MFHRYAVEIISTEPKIHFFKTPIIYIKRQELLNKTMRLGYFEVLRAFRFTIGRFKHLIWSKPTIFKLINDNYMETNINNSSFAVVKYLENR